MPTHAQGHPPNRWREIHLVGTNEPAHAVAGGAQVVPYEGGGRRADELIDDVQSRLHAGRIDKMFQRLDEALDATVLIRGTGPDGRMRYVREPDHASRLTAIRLGLAYKYGNPVSAAEIRMLRAPGAEPTRQSPEDALRELRATGLDLENVVKSWMASLDNVTPSAKPAKIAETGPTAPLADAFLDV